MYYTRSIESVQRVPFSNTFAVYRTVRAVLHMIKSGAANTEQPSWTVLCTMAPLLAAVAAFLWELARGC